MSQFIGGAQPQNIIASNDVRINRMDFRVESEFDDIWIAGTPCYISDWWPTRGGFMGDQETDVGMLQDWKGWGEYDQSGGGSSRYGFTGVTRDEYGSPIAGCTVKLFRTSNDELLDTTTSDAFGRFLLSTAYYPDQHYIVSQKVGSPNVQGITVNTLVGA